MAERQNPRVRGQALITKVSNQDRSRIIIGAFENDAMDYIHVAGTLRNKARDCPFYIVTVYLRQAGVTLSNAQVIVLLM